MALYKGFSSFEYQKEGTFLLTDIELVKMDILNHIFTRRGERVGMPTFGTSIPDLVFEPLDQDTIEVLNEELTQVIQFDPRVELISLSSTPNYSSSSLTVAIKLLYIELNITDDVVLNIQFEN